MSNTAWGNPIIGNHDPRDYPQEWEEDPELDLTDEEMDAILKAYEIGRMLPTKENVPF